MYGVLLLAVTAAAPAVAATPAVNICSILSNDYEQIQKAMASRWADSIGDNSASRATLSEMKENNDLIRAQMTVELMRARNCPLPQRAPALGRYLSPALEHDDKKWEPVFVVKSCDHKYLEHDDDSKKSHHALSCATARSKSSLARQDTTNLPECDVTKWTLKD